jgi:hypothetical protein
VTDLESQVVDLMDEMRTDGTDGVA